MADILKENLIDAEERRSEQVRTKPLHVGAVLGIVLLIFAMPAIYRPSESGKLPFDRHQITQLNAIRPDYVLIGNSMLGTRIDPAVLEERLGKNCCYVMSTAGAESAWDHQALKNSVLAADKLPKKVFIFFRDTYLTRPSYRAQDVYWWRIEYLSHEEEPELDRAMKNSRTWQETLEYQLGRLYPIQKRRYVASAWIEWLAGRLSFSTDDSRTGSPGAKYNALFGLNTMRVIEADDTAFDANDDANYDFNAKVDNSLLPSMIRQAKDKGVDLVFVRVQRRPRENGPPVQSQRLQAYVAQLKEYLSKNGVGFYDFTGDSELTLDHYLDGDHIRPEWRRESTENFLQRMGAYLQ